MYVCSSCFFDIKAVSTRLLTSKGIMYIKASNMVRLFSVELTAVQSTIENQSTAYREQYMVRFLQHIVRFPQHIVRFPQVAVRKFCKVQFGNLHLNQGFRQIQMWSTKMHSASRMLSNERKIKNQMYETIPCLRSEEEYRWNRLNKQQTVH